MAPAIGRMTGKLETIDSYVIRNDKALVLTGLATFGVVGKPEVIAYVPINAVTGKVGPGTQVTGKPTNRDLG